MVNIPFYTMHFDLFIELHQKSPTTIFARTTVVDSMRAEMF